MCAGLRDNSDGYTRTDSVRLLTGAPYLPQAVMGDTHPQSVSFQPFELDPRRSPLEQDLASQMHLLEALLAEMRC